MFTLFAYLFIPILIDLSILFLSQRRSSGPTPHTGGPRTASGLRTPPSTTLWCPRWRSPCSRAACTLALRSTATLKWVLYLTCTVEVENNLSGKKQGLIVMQRSCFLKQDSCADEIRHTESPDSKLIYIIESFYSSEIITHQRKGASLLLPFLLELQRYSSWKPEWKHLKVYILASYIMYNVIIIVNNQIFMSRVTGVQYIPSLTVSKNRLRSQEVSVRLKLETTNSRPVL